MKNRPKWHLVLLLGLALLLASSFIGCDNSPPVINEFSASPSEITAGESTTLEWSVTGATTINIDQGIDTVPAHGNLSVSPSSTIAYTLSATNDAGTVTKSAVITVTPSEELSQEKEIPPAEAIPWQEAKNYVGQVKVVEGPVVDAGYFPKSNGRPTFLNLGKPYPDLDRFTVVIWIDHRDKFVKEFPPNPETYFLHKTVRVKGFIDTYKGNPQIVLSEPSKIWIVE